MREQGRLPHGHRFRAILVAETKQIHRIDSFFSMHETMGQLDVQVRDDVLSCIQRLESFDEETILLLAGTIPTACMNA